MRKRNLLAGVNATETLDALAVEWVLQKLLPAGAEQVDTTAVLDGARAGPT